jgi:isopenicillin-N epimerase
VDNPSTPAGIRYGRSIRSLWELADDATFLNHGSYGACPKIVLAEQDRIRVAMEREPDAFFRNEIQPREGAETALRRAASAFAAFVGVEGRQLAFVENATVGAQAVLRAISFKRGDRILVTNHTYNAVRLMVDARCAETGAEPAVARIPLPAGEDATVERIIEACVPGVKIAVLDHITSPTALLLPLDRIIPELRRRGVVIFVDGAHGVGQVPLDLKALAPDWYVSNGHKWLYCPKGCAFLYASDTVAPMTRPNVVSHFHAMEFPLAFDYTGTRDNSGWLAVPAAIRFLEGLDPGAARAHMRAILERCTAELETLGAKPIAPLAPNVAMRSFHLPQDRPATPDDAALMMRGLWEEERIQVACHAFEGRLLLRVSAQAYVDNEDIGRLAQALARRGWPGRGGKQ